MIQLGHKEIRVRGRVIRIAYLDGEGYTFLDNPELALRRIRDSRKRIDLFTFVQKLSETTPKYGYPTEWDNMAALPIVSFDHWLKGQIDFKVRNKVRKAEKSGINVREVPFDDELIRGVHAIYNECPVRQGKRFWHFGKDLEAVRAMNATFMEQSIFIGAYFQDVLVGFVKLVSDEGCTQAGLMQIISTIQHRDKAPTNALIAQAVRSCADRNIPYLWYASFSYGKKQEDSLATFKKHNGFQKVEIPRYYVPLTGLGRIALRMGFHHSLKDRVPEPIAAGFRKLRSFWYERTSPDLQNA